MMKKIYIFLLLGLTAGILSFFYFSYLELKEDFNYPELKKEEIRKEELIREDFFRGKLIKEDIKEEARLPGKIRVKTATKSVITKNKVIKSYAGAKIAIILDDAGYSIDNELIELPYPLGISILPYKDKKATKLAELCHHKNKEILLHLPMENISGTKSCSFFPYYVSTSMSPEQIVSNLEGALNIVTYAKGVNNHEGSKATADSSTMSILLNSIKEKGLYFVDSLTTPNSVGYKVAKDIGVNTLKRDIFLDNINEVSYVKKQLYKLVELAHKRGYAVGIGHVTKKATIKVLKEELPILIKKGVEIITPSSLLNYGTRTVIPSDQKA